MMMNVFHGQTEVTRVVQEVCAYTLTEKSVCEVLIQKSLDIIDRYHIIYEDERVHVVF